jgi:hypothetical protein
MIFVPNMKGIAALGLTPMMREALRRRGEAAAEQARVTAPYQSGNYRDSIGVDIIVEDGTAVARLLASDFKASWIEFGTVKWPAHRTLRNAVEASGLKLKEEYKRGQRA